MKINYSFIFLLATFVWSCTGDMAEEANPSDISVSGPGNLKPLYHEGTDTWIRPYKDPFALDNMQTAYDMLARKKQTSDAVSRKLSATHYATKLYPKNEEEQWSLETMKDVFIAYVPFDYKQLSEMEIAVVDNSLPVEVFADESRYTVTHDDYETVEGPADPVTIVLPVLYAVWPCDKPFPQGLDYEVLYEVFLPEYTADDTRANDLGIEALQELEAEAIRIANVETTTRATRNWESRTVRGSVHHYDKLMNKYVPMAYLRIRYQLGSKRYEATTGNDGRYSISTTVPADASLYLLFQYDDKWKITPESTTRPITELLGSHYEIYTRNDFDVYVKERATPHYEIHRAANFYMNGRHSVPTYYYKTGLRIRAIGRTDDKNNGFFSYSKNDESYLSIYYNNKETPGSLVGTILHELGHFTHFAIRGYSEYKYTDRLLKDSYASYVGWYLCEKYYFSIDYMPYGGFDFTSQARQDWKLGIVGDGIYYSPLFVDLVDEYDQSGNSIFSVFCTDVIKNVPHEIISRIATESKEWKTCRNILEEYIGTYYNRTDLDNLLRYYDAYFQN